MLRFPYSLVPAVLVTATLAMTGGVLLAAAEDNKESSLIKVLQSDAPKADKAITCKHLAVWGTADAVPALAALLPDEELTSWARIALEAIPDPAADEALRDALGSLQGRIAIGVINSIGVRRDAKAVGELVERMQGADAQVASAAAAALGKIGDESATAALRKALADAPEGVRSAVAEGCILCAEKLLAEGKADAAAELYDEVRQADVPKPRYLEATRGAILAQGSAGVPLLVEQLKSGDKALVNIGLASARELTGKGVTQGLVAELGSVSQAKQALLILALADRGDAEVIPAMLEAAKSDSDSVRIAAFDVLQKLGDETCVPTLLSAAAEADADVAEAAMAALKSLPGDKADAELVSRLANTKGKERQVLIKLVGLRRIAAVPALLKAVDDADPQIRSAALTALGEVVELSDLSVLIGRVVSPSNSDDTQVALKALRAACVRMPDGEACADRLAAAMSQAPLSAKVAILETLTAMGGTNALQAVGAAASGDSPEMQDAATRLLGSWMTVDAGPVLLELAEGDGQYKVRALRGYIRLVRQFLMPDAQRAAMCRSALKVAERDAERQLVLEVIERYPSVDMLRLAVATSEIPSLKDDAAAAALAVAQKIGGSTDVQDLLKQVKGDPVKIEIVKAQYGAGDKQQDVTEILRRHLRDFPLVVLPTPRYNAAFGGDPAPNVVKQLRVQYRMDGKAGDAVFSENSSILLPKPE